MLRHTLRFSIPVLSLLFLVGCGPRKYTVSLNPNYFHDQYQTENSISNITPAITFSKGTYTDKRTDKEVFGKSKGFHILTDNEFGDAFYDGLKTFLTSSKQSWADDAQGDIKIDVDLLATQSELIMGFWVVQFMSQVSTKVTFVDQRTGQTIYQKDYEGIERLRTPAGHESMFKMVVNKSIVDCLNKIGSDEVLRDALTGAR